MRDSIQALILFAAGRLGVFFYKSFSCYWTIPVWLSEKIDHTHIAIFSFALYISAHLRCACKTVAVSVSNSESTIVEGQPETIIHIKSHSYCTDMERIASVPFDNIHNK